LCRTNTDGPIGGHDVRAIILASAENGLDRVHDQETEHSPRQARE
jgi:hypothetical protein